MKKLIAISMMIALVAGAAFAQANIGFTLDTRLDVNGASAGGFVAGDGSNATWGDAPLPTIGGSIADGYLQASGANDDGTFGGLVRIKANTYINNHGAGGDGIGFHRAFIWWKPIDQVRIFLGKEKDGMYSTGGALTDWAFHQGAEGYLNFHDWGYWRSVFPGNWDAFGLALEFYPIDGLNINLVVPTGGSPWPNDTDTTRIALEALVYNLRLQANYTIGGIGTIYFSYIGAGKPAEGAKDYSNGNIGASFLLDGPVEGLRAQIGFATDLNAGDRKSPLYLGLAAHYTAGDWGVKFRSAFEISYVNSGAGASYNAENGNQFSWVVNSHAGSGSLAEGIGIQFNIMPWYNFGFLEARLDFGLRMVMPKDSDPSSKMGWHVNPYVRVPIPGGRFIAGVRVQGRTDSRVGAGDGTTITNAYDVEQSIVTWSVPLGFVFSF